MSLPRPAAPPHDRETETDSDTHPSGGFELSISPARSHAFSPGLGGNLCSSSGPVHPAPQGIRTPALTVPGRGRFSSQLGCKPTPRRPGLWLPTRQQSGAVSSHPPPAVSALSHGQTPPAPQPGTPKLAQPRTQSRGREGPLRAFRVERSATSGSLSGAKASGSCRQPFLLSGLFPSRLCGLGEVSTSAVR